MGDADAGHKRWMDLCRELMGVIGPAVPDEVNEVVQKFIDKALLESDDNDTDDDVESDDDDTDDDVDSELETKGFEIEKLHNEIEKLHNEIEKLRKAKDTEIEKLRKAKDTKIEKLREEIEEVRRTSVAYQREVHELSNYMGKLMDQTDQFMVLVDNKLDM